MALAAASHSVAPQATICPPFVEIDVLFVRQWLFAVGLLCWPLLLLGHPPYYFPDTLTYFADALHVSPAAGVVAASLKATRSAAYAETMLLLHGPRVDLTLLAVAQVAVAAFVITTVRRVFVAAPTLARSATVMIALVLASPVAWVSCLAMPDSFTGPLIAAMLLLICYPERLSPLVVLFLTAIAAFAVTAHISHLPLAVGIGLAGVAWQFVAGQRHGRWGWLVPLRSVGIGSAIIMVVGFALFGEISLAPKRYPLALARSFEDGPARWYLDQNCARLRFTICAFDPTHLPRDVNGFLWGANGIVHRATPAQMDRIRAEESAVVLGAATVYPRDQIRAAIDGTARQLVHFGIDDELLDRRLVPGHAGMLDPVVAGGRHRGLVRILDGLSIGATIAALSWLIARFRTLGRADRAALLLLGAGIIGNAVICGAFSGVADRYQARVIWLVLLFALALPTGGRAARIEP